MRINSINSSYPINNNQNKNIYFGHIDKCNVVGSQIVNGKYLVVFSGPSGVGKDTILRNLKGAFNKIVTYTTRGPRPGETNGIDYFYTNVDEFKKAIENNEFAEYVENYGDFYGTKKSTILETIQKSDKPLVLNINVDGARNLKKLLADKVNIVSIFIKPESLETLSKWLNKRGTESAEQIAKRLAKAQSEIDQADNFDIIVSNLNSKDSAGEIAGALNLKV